jgi:hypothetical protein
LIRKLAPKLEPFIHSGMLAYGPSHYQYASGREGDYICAAGETGYGAQPHIG